MSIRFSYSQDHDSGLWHVTGDDGERSVTIAHESRDEATAQAQEAFGLVAYRPPPPPPPGHHRFVLMESYFGARDARPDDPRYDAIKSSLPQGCSVGDCDYSFSLDCVCPGTHLLDAIATTCAEIRETHGLFFADAGVEKSGNGSVTAKMAGAQPSWPNFCSWQSSVAISLATPPRT
ncbi:hypothetical protein JMUB6875_15390 [Nocardia sp. JMUB6875]|uniref:hypothetical protein n=1 Tax=Nocardia sp. JMUB6875 TaxID=3158170 RepID=UPI0032E711F4